MIGLMKKDITLVTPYRILCVCLGNICRSPTAEAIFKAKIKDFNIEVDSAGTAAYHIGSPPDLRSQTEAKKYGYNLSNLRARQITLQDFDAFDLILAMDQQNLENIQKLKPSSCRAHIAMLDSQPIADPYYGGAQGFTRVLKQCEVAADQWLAKLIKQNKVIKK